MNTPLKVYIGYDSRESEAYGVAVNSIRTRASRDVSITGLKLEDLERAGLITRPWTINNNVRYDLISQAPQSTEFAVSRFLVPLLAHDGWAMFLDPDVVALDDIYSVMEHADPDYAVMVVKHKQLVRSGETKMDGQPQLAYARKNWSSVVLWNCYHRGNRRLTLNMINSLPGRDLHAFCWLWDNEIGELPAEWNWLVNVNTKPEKPKIAHYTLGGPWFEGWQSQPNDVIWLRERYGEEAVQKLREGKKLHATDLEEEAAEA